MTDDTPPVPVPAPEPPSPPPPPVGAVADLPDASTRRSRWIGTVWALPLAALLIVAFLGLRALSDRGIDIVVTFPTGAGARVDDTKVIYQGVEAGRVTKVRLNEDGRSVDMTIKIDPRPDLALTTTTQFWLVGVNPSLNDISSVKAALAGVTIGVSPGRGGTPTRRFVGRSEPPIVAPGTPGTAYQLTTGAIGNLSVGSQIFYHGQQIGRLTALEFVGVDAFRLDIFVQAPYDRLIVPAALFWVSSPVQVSLAGEGARATIEHASSLLNGAIEVDLAGPATGPETGGTAGSPGAGSAATGLAAAAASGAAASGAAASGAAASASGAAASASASGPPGATATASPPASAAGTVFPLYQSRRDAELGAPGPGVPYTLRFRAPAGDLAIGAAVRLLGFPVGSVRAVRLEVDPAGGGSATVVDAVLYPQRLGLARPARPAGPVDGWQRPTDAFVERLLASGHRATLTQTPPLIGARGIAFDRARDRAGPASGTPRLGPARLIPSDESGGDLEQITGQASQLLARLNRVPLDAIGADVQRITGRLAGILASPELTGSLQHLNRTLAGADRLVADVTPQIGPLVTRLNAAADELNATAAAARGVLTGDGGRGGDANLPQAVRELSDAARSIRVLADYLGRHPESLLRGRGAGEPALPPASGAR